MESEDAGALRRTPLSGLRFLRKTLQLSRRPKASSAGRVLQPHGAASKTNLLHPRNWLQRERSKDTRPLSKPPVCPSGPNSIISRPPGVTPTCFCWMTEDRATPPLPLRRQTRCRRLALLASQLHTGPMREQGELCAVRFTPGQSLGGPSGPPGEREGLPIHQAPPRLQLHLHPASSHGFMPSAPDSKSLSPGLARRRGWPWSGSATRPARGRPRQVQPGV